MELQFNKTVIPCLRTLSREVQTQEQTQEVRLTDGMPDVGNVLACWGQLLIRGKEWRSGGMSVSGGVMAWVLYEPEDGGEPQCVETWLPFQMKWDFSESERDGGICVSPLLRGMDARTVSARKLMVRAGVSILGEAMVPAEIELYEPGELPEDLCLQKNKYPIQLPREVGEKAFSLEETLSLPASAAALDKIIHYSLRPELIDRKIVSDKVVFRGTTVLHVLYRSEDGQLHSWDFDIPFSQYAELDREYEPESMVKIDLAVTNLELDRGEEEDLLLKAGLTGQYVVYDNSVVEIVGDAYSPHRQVTPEVSRLHLPTVLDRVEQTFGAQQAVELDGGRIADVAFYPEHPRIYRESDKSVAEMSGVFHLLYSDENGQLGSQNARWEDEWVLPASGDARIEMNVQPTGKPQVSVGNGEVTVKADMHISAMATEGQGMPMVTALALSEAAQPDPNRPSLVLRRAGNDSLWEIAKRAGSTVEMIQNANGLTQDPGRNQMLLIPVV